MPIARGAGFLSLGHFSGNHERSGETRLAREHLESSAGRFERPSESIYRARPPHPANCPGGRSACSGSVSPSRRKPSRPTSSPTFCGYGSQGRELQTRVSPTLFGFEVRRAPMSIEQVWPLEAQKAQRCTQRFPEIVCDSYESSLFQLDDTGSSCGSEW